MRSVWLVSECLNGSAIFDASRHECSPVVFTVQCERAPCVNEWVSFVLGVEIRFTCYFLIIQIYAPFYLGARAAKRTQKKVTELKWISQNVGRSMTIDVIKSRIVYGETSAYRFVCVCAISGLCHVRARTHVWRQVRYFDLMTLSTIDPYWHMCVHNVHHSIRIKSHARVVCGHDHDFNRLHSFRFSLLFF